MRGRDRDSSGQGRPAEPTGAARGLAGRAAREAFRALSRLRGRRIVHPQGVGYAATCTVTGGPVPWGVPLLDEPAEHLAVVRLSRGVGLPEPLPDVLGLALRLLDVHGPGRHQDFLLVTSTELPVLHHLILPAAGFFPSAFSSVLPYRVGRRLALVGARSATAPARRAPGALAELELAAAAGPVVFEIGLAPPARRLRTVARLRLGERLPDEEAERLAFTPWNTGGGIRPAGPFMGLRRPAYGGSQAGRGLPAREIP